VEQQATLIMQVSAFVKEALDDAPLYSLLEHKPDVERLFASGRALRAFEQKLDASFVNVFNQPCGYYQLKRHCVRTDEMQQLTFLEEASTYRQIIDPFIRARRFVPVLFCIHCWNVRITFV
jgi:hypothetical protein